MKNYKIAKRYAKAVFHLAGEQRQREDVYADVSGLLRLFADSADFGRFLRHPAIAAERQRAIMRALLEQDVRPLTMRFLEFIIRKNKLFLLRDICEIFEDLY